MLRTTTVNFRSQIRTANPRVFTKIAAQIRQGADQIARKHSDTTKTDNPTALADLAQLKNVEDDLGECLRVLTEERTAVTVARNILKGEPYIFTSDHPLIAHAMQLETQIAVIKMEDSNLVDLDLFETLQSLDRLTSELDSATTVFNNRHTQALAVTRKARGLAVCRCTSLPDVIKLLPDTLPLPQTGEWLKIGIGDSLIKDCRRAVMADNQSFANKRIKIKKKIADKNLENLREVN